MKPYLLLLLFTLPLLNQVSGQDKLYPNIYLVRFTDKGNNTFNLANPAQYLSDRAIQRRAKQNISINEADLPISSYYTDSLTRMGFTIIKQSKWLNAVCIKTSTPSQLDALKTVSFVAYRALSPQLKFTAVPANKFIAEKELDFPSIAEEDATINQISIHNADFLYRMGYRGQSMLVAVNDGGFVNANKMTVFDSLWKDNRVFMMRNFVSPTSDVFTGIDHGSMVLSTMASTGNTSLKGTAPKATYALFVTEDGPTEYPIEEFNWAMAAEVADSIGVDVINTSLGYTTFDDVSLNHTYANMDGQSTLISKATRIAASKGMIVVVAAGNEGSDSWHYISAPADVDSILTVGAIDLYGARAPFSSVGPTFDGRIKPDVMATGWQTTISTVSNVITKGDGTSFASPIMAGLTACLWQAFPNKTNMEIIEAIKKSSSLYSSPNSNMGYGIPNFSKAWVLLGGSELLDTQNQVTTSKNALGFFPNPFSSHLTISIKGNRASQAEVSFFDLTGRLAFKATLPVNTQNNFTISLNALAALPQGLYLVSVSTGVSVYRGRVFKQ